jgi:hypothetical protein
MPRPGIRSLRAVTRGSNPVCTALPLTRMKIVSLAAPSLPAPRR